MFTSEQQSTLALVVMAFWIMLATCLPAAETTSPKDKAGQAEANISPKQDLPPPEFETSLAIPSSTNDHSSPLESNDARKEGNVLESETTPDRADAEISEDDVTMDVADEPLLDEIDLGEDFISEQEADDSWQHSMPLLQSSGTWLWRGHWYTEQALVAMYRSAPNNKILSRDVSYTQRIFGIQQSPVTIAEDNQDPLQTAGQTFRTETGVKLTIGNIIGRDSYNRDHAIEFSFCGFFNFVGRDTITASQGPGSNDIDFNVYDLGANPFRLDGLNLDPEVGPTSGIFSMPISVVGFSNARTHAYIYEADLNSYELNLRKRSRLRRDRLLLQPGGKWHRDINSGRILTLLGGMRMIRHNERFLWNSTDAIDSDGGNSATGVFETQTHNDMFGFQLGAGVLEQKASWHWGFKTTGGVLYNFADRTIQINVHNLGQNRALNDFEDDNQAVFLGEAGAYIGWHLRPNVTLKASYDILYYTGIAVARDGIEINGRGASQTSGNSLDPGNFQPAQVTDTFRPLELRNDAFYHAFSLGFEVVW